MSGEFDIVEQKTVTFYDDELIAIRASDGQIYVSVRQMCESLGLDTQGQTRRIGRHDILASGLQGVANLATPGGVQKAYVLRVDLIPLWLAGIRTSAVNDEARPKLEQFQREAAKVLWEAFQEGRLTMDVAFEELLHNDSPAAQAYNMALAIMKMARQQLILEAQIETHSNRLTDHEKRLELIEERLGDSGSYITPDQAMQISQSIKTIALEMGKRTKKNEYGAVYGQLYRQFGITGYKQLPASQFDKAMKWLTDWYQRITGATGDNLPF